MFLRIKFSPPPPTPEFLSKDFPSATRPRTEILTKENLVGTKNCSHCSFQDFHSLSKGNQVSLVRTFLSEPGSGSKIGRLGGWGWKNGLEFWSVVAAVKYCSLTACRCHPFSKHPNLQGSLEPSGPQIGRERTTLNPKARKSVPVFWPLFPLYAGAFFL